MRLAGVVILLSFVFPRLLNETKINDDIKKLRYFIFFGMVWYFVINLILLQINFCNIFNCWNINATHKTAVIQALAILNINFILALIYHQKYK